MKISTLILVGSAAALLTVVGCKKDESADSTSGAAGSATTTTTATATATAKATATATTTAQPVRIGAGGAGGAGGAAAGGAGSPAAAGAAGAATGAAGAATGAAGAATGGRPPISIKLPGKKLARRSPRRACCSPTSPPSPGGLWFFVPRKPRDPAPRS